MQGILRGRVLPLGMGAIQNFHEAPCVLERDRKPSLPGTPVADIRILLEGCLKGDPKSWEEFIARFHRVIEGSVRLVYWRCVYVIPEADVANVVQDLYARLFEDDYRRLRSYRGRCPFELWLRSMATHHALNVIRNDKLRGRFGGGDLESLPMKPDSGSCGSDQAEKQEDLRRLRVYLDQLGPLQKTVLRMMYEDGQSYQEISRALGIPVQTLGSILTRARERLRHLMMGRNPGRIE